MKERLLLEKNNYFIRLILNNPDKHNRLDQETINLMSALLDNLLDEENLRALIITGAGDHTFCAGFDITSLPKTDSKKISIYPQNPIEHLMEKIENFPIPTIAQINGSVFGGGMELICSCDIRIAANHAQFALPPAKFGIMYPPEGVRRFISVLGTANTKFLLFTAEKINSDNALKMGLLHRIVTPERLEEEVQKVADSISHCAPLSVKGMKKEINTISKKMDLSEEELQYMYELAGECYKSKDYNEGLQAFMQKREPNFKGE